MNPDPSELPLRDIHLPDAVPWWPPAPGWWVLAVLLLLLVAVALWWVRRHRRRRWVRAALVELDALESGFRSDGNAHRLCQGLSLLLKRVVSFGRPHSSAPGLSGEDWLAFLDRTLGDASFSEGQGRVLVEGPYDPRVTVDGDALVALCRRWIRSFRPDTAGR